MATNIIVNPKFRSKSDKTMRRGLIVRCGQSIGKQPGGKTETEGIPAMVVLNGKISGTIYRQGSNVALNGYAAHANGHANGSVVSNSPEDKYQEVMNSLNVVRKELDRISESITEQAETTAAARASNSFETYRSSALEYNVSTRNGSNLPEKRFEQRQSILTDMFAIPHIRTAYNVAVTIFLMLLLHDFAIDYLINGERPKFIMTFSTLWYSFTGFHRAIGIWIVMFLATLFTYAGFTWWAHQRSYLISTTRQIFDYFSIAALVIYLGLFMYLPVWRMRLYDLGLSSVVAVLLEQVRLLMKMTAFIRSNVPRALEATKEPIYATEDEDDDEEDTSKLLRKAYPNFNKFLYFLFVPTVVYRDHYPRTKKVRWRVVATCFIEVAACVILDGYLLERFILPQTRKYGAEMPAGFASIATIHVSSLLTCLLMVLLGHYALFHAWQNAFAEMLMFGDRLFYLDWWNQKDYSTWFRTWNVVIQDWLFTYVYRDVVLLTRNKILAKACVFIVSAVFHEYVLACAFQFFMPLQFIMFMLIGGAMTLLNLRSNSSLGNIFILFSLTFGNTMMVILYSIEFYARINCGKSIKDSMDFFFLRSFNCQT